MTHTHVSHFGLTLLGESGSSILFSGSLADCKRMAAAHGMSVDRAEGPILYSDGGKAVYGPADPSRPMRVLYRDGGLIQRTQDAYILVMPLAVWQND